MKKSIFTAIAFIAVISITNQSFAQESNKVRPGYDVKANVKARIVQTDNGCTVVFENSVASSKDIATGQSSGKRGYDYYKSQSEFSVSAVDNAVTEVKGPRDQASGQSTGKRTHKPISVSGSGTSPDAATAKGSGGGAGKANFQDLSFSKVNVQEPISVSGSGTSPDAATAKGSGGGAGKANFQDLSFSKVNVQDISFTKRCGGKTTKLSVVDGECLIPTDSCPDGTCSITVDWSWGMSQSGTSAKKSSNSGRCVVEFSLEIEDGVCHAINTKGSGATRDGDSK
jgi:hypothetical protein